MRATHWRNIRIMAVTSVAGLLVCSTAAMADYTYGTATQVPNVNSSAMDGGPQISRDGLELYFNSNREPGISGCGHDIWVSRRATVQDPWSKPVRLGGPMVGECPSLTADRLEMYVADGYGGTAWGECTVAAGGYGESDLWVYNRASQADPWDSPTNLGPVVNSANQEAAPCISADGLELYFMSDSPGGNTNPTNADVFVTTRPTRDAPWGSPVKLGPNVNGSEYEFSPWISADGLSLYFSRGYLKAHVWVSKRKTTNDPWGPAEFFAPFSPGTDYSVYASGQTECCVSYSSNDPTLYFSRGTDWFTPDWDLWQVPIIPIVDFGGDGRVDIRDLLRLITYWGQSEPSVDIGPLAWGDGKVDQEDLKILMGRWGQEVLDPNLLAHWAFDETEGTVVHSSVGVGPSAEDGTTRGGPVWMSTGGSINGALQLDGVDDYVEIPYVVDPGKGPFSIFAWIKGGAPGQVIVSQYSKSNWLSTDPAAGCLMTEVRTSGSPGVALFSRTAVTDGNWHRVGLVWDGKSRILYVDDVEVARDTQPGLASANLGLLIGKKAILSSKAKPWSGLIDEVRIHNRAVHP